MRLMRNDLTGNVLKVTEHIILRNFWEYYVLDADTNTAENKLCLVLGFENEIGDVHMPEIKEYTINKASGKELNDIMPAPGYSWVN